MHVNARFLNTDQVEVSLTLTLTLYQWKRLKQQIGGVEYAYPINDLRHAINAAISKLEGQVSEHVPTELEQEKP